jgi:hypothetical protein
VITSFARRARLWPAVWLLAGAAVFVPGSRPEASNRTQARVNKDAAAIAEFMTRVQAYAALHKKLDGTLREVPDGSPPEQFFEHQRTLAGLLRRERATAKPGDLCPVEMRAFIRRQLAVTFRGENGRQIKRSILDEFTGNVRLEVNGGYPDDVPVSTTPAQVLEALPSLPDTLQYRFIGKRLILLDAHAHIIADFVDHIFP